MITLTSGAPSATRGDHRAFATGKTRLRIALAGVTTRGRSDSERCSRSLVPHHAEVIRPSVGVSVQERAPGGRGFEPRGRGSAELRGPVRGSPGAVVVGAVMGP